MTWQNGHLATYLEGVEKAGYASVRRVLPQRTVEVLGYSSHAILTVASCRASTTVHADRKALEDNIHFNNQTLTSGRGDGLGELREIGAKALGFPF